MARRAPRQQALALGKPSLLSGYECRVIDSADFEALPAPVRYRRFDGWAGESMVFVHDCDEIAIALARARPP